LPELQKIYENTLQEKKITSIINNRKFKLITIFLNQLDFSENMGDYDLELDKAVKEIKKQKAKRVCVQLPDGLKPKAKEIADEIENQTPAKVIIWIGSCFGACDVPQDIERLGIDMLIQWGHSEWKY